MIRNSKLLFFVLTVLLFSCKKQKDLSVPEVQSGNFYPLVKGNYRLYQVAKTNFKLLGKVDSSFQLKELFSESFTGLDGQIHFKLLRYKKRMNTDSLSLDSVWSAQRMGEDKVLVVENNQAVLKLFLPLFNGRTWNGNLHNDKFPEVFTVSNLNSPWETYPKTVTIVERNDTNLLKRSYRVSIYAENIGLVYRENRELNFSASGDDFGKGIITDGVIVSQKLISHGTE